MADLHRTPTHPVARKAHKCIACLTDIPVGEKYIQQEGFYDGRAFRNRFHYECWGELSQDGEFEFCPGDVDPPARLTSQEKAP